MSATNPTSRRDFLKKSSLLAAGAAAAGGLNWASPARPTPPAAT